MALVISDRVKETTTTTGTGTYTLGGAVTGFETFTTNLSNSDTTYYCCTDNTDFEVGLGTFTSSGTTLARTAILASSNSNNAVSWSSGTRTVFCTLPAAKTVFLDASGNTSISGSVTATSFVIGSADINENDLESIDGITAGTVAASKAAIVDTNKDITGFRNITLTGELDAGSLDVSGDADIDGTLEADAITVNGTALATVIAGTTVSNVTVSDSTTNSNFPVVFHNESNGLLDDTGALRYNPSTGELLVPKLTVAGTTTTVDTVTMQAENAIIFEGATADAHETTLTIVDTTGDRTINLPNVSGTLPVLAAASTTQITSTPEELNILDGVTSTAAELNVLDGITAVVGELNALDLGSTAVGTAIASKAVILDSNKDYTGIRNLTITGELDGATLDISGNADIDGTLEADAITIGGTSTDTLYASPGFAVAMAIAL